MNAKTLGTLIIAIGITMGVLVGLFKYNTSLIIDQQMELSGGTCFENGVCLHQQYAFNMPTYAGIILSVLTIALGAYILFFARTQQVFLETIKETRRQGKEEKGEERFAIILKALSPEERLAMQKVREQDGITQTTLMLRTDLSKTKLSFVLSDLEKKGLIKKVREGKINRIHIKEAI